MNLDRHRFCVFWGSLRIFQPLKSAAHFEVDSVLRTVLRYCVLTVQYAGSIEVCSVLRIAYCVLAAHFEVGSVLRIAYCVLAL